jgi:molybdopterin synthase catalytic subunit
MTWARVSPDVIDVASIEARAGDAGHGAIVTFVGAVRDVADGRAVSGLEYSAYEAMAERELRAIVVEAEARWGARIAAQHRVGALGIGDVAVAIAAGHGHRAQAFDACRYVIEEVKRRVPVWKREHYLDGTREWVAGCTVHAPAER